MRPWWGESKADQERKKQERKEYDEGLAAQLPSDDQEPPSSSSSSSSSSADLLGDDDDFVADPNKDYIPSTPAKLSQSKAAGDNTEIKQAEITISPSTRKLTPPPPNRPTTPLRTGAATGPPQSPRNVAGRPTVGGKQPRSSQRIPTPPPPVTTVRQLQKPAPVTAEQYALKIRIRSPTPDEDVTSDDFRDKVENARSRASRTDSLPPFPLVSPPSIQGDRASPPTPLKKATGSQKRKEAEKSKLLSDFILLFPF